MDIEFMQAINGLTPTLKNHLNKLDENTQKQIHEIRIRRYSPISISIRAVNYFLGDDGQLYPKPNKNCPTISKSDIENSFVSLCDYSVHSHQPEIAKGFISLFGGHRVGLSATAIYDEKGTVKNLRDITSYVIRIARTITKVATPIIDMILSKNLCGIVIAGEPSSGKTTILCDLVRQLSHGDIISPCAVCVIDERGEISPRISLEYGSNCEMLVGYTKSEGIVSAVRSLAPRIIICDEVGGQDDVNAIIWSLNCGVPIITTIHGKSYNEIIKRPTGKLLLDSGAFDYMLILEGAGSPCKIKEVVDLNGSMAKTDRCVVFNS